MFLLASMLGPLTARTAFAEGEAAEGEQVVIVETTTEEPAAPQGDAVVFVDTDGDGIEDAADATPNGDTDGDGIDNLADATPNGDDDGDGIDNLADPTPNGEPVVEEAPEAATNVTTGATTEQVTDVTTEVAVDETVSVVTQVSDVLEIVPDASVSCATAEAAAPWIASDLADYPPGALVTLTGGGWVAGQTVELFIDDDGVADAVMGEWSLYTTVQADANGYVIYGFTLPDWFVANYFVTATGECSNATTTFTDATNTVTSLARTSGANPSQLGQPITFTATVVGAVEGPNVRPTPNGVGTVTFKDGSVNIVGCTNVALTANTASCVTASLSPGLHTITAVYNGTGGETGFNSSTSNSISHTVNTVAATSLSVSAATGTYGLSVNLSATLTANGSPVAGQPVNFTLNGTGVGAATTNASGIATLTNVSIAGIDAGTYPNAVAGSFVATTAYSASSGTAALTVNKAPATISLSGLGHTYDGTAKSATATTTPVGLSTVTITYDGSTTAPTNAGSYAVVATLTNANYQPTDATGTLVIDKADQEITFTTLAPAAAKYGDVYNASAASDAGLDVMLGASGACAIVDGAVEMTDVGECVVTASQAGNSNYNPAEDVTQRFNVGKATATLTLSNTSHTWNGTAKSVTVTTSPVPGLETITVTYDGSTVQPTRSGTYAVVATLNHRHYEGTTSGSMTIKSLVDIQGPFQPIDMGVFNTAKGGSTIPVKFKILINGQEVTSSENLTIRLDTRTVACTGGSELGDEIQLEQTTTGSTSVRYDSTSGHWIYNWKTSKVPSDQCYVLYVTVTAADGSIDSTDHAYIKLKK